MVEAEANPKVDEQPPKETKVEKQQSQVDSLSYGSERAAMESPPKPKTEMYVPITEVTDTKEKKG